jgi:hypothetical protein
MSTTIHTRDQVAQRYLNALKQGRFGDRVASAEPEPFHFVFADAVLGRDAYALQHLANGMNNVAKRVFTEVTGVALPRTQRDTWAALLAWAGVSQAADAVRSARASVELQVRVLRKRTKDADELARWATEQAEQGMRLLHIKGRWYFMHPKRRDGFDLSKRGSHLSLVRPLIQAVIDLVEAQARLAAETPVPADAATEPSSNPPLVGNEPLAA